MAVLYRRAVCLTAKHGGFRPGQWAKFDPYASGYIYLFWLKRLVRGQRWAALSFYTAIDCH